MTDWLVDFHVHTAASFDCLCRPEAVLARARRRGLDRVAITDHDTWTAARTLAARAPEAVLVGAEVRTREGVDIIGLLLREPVAPGQPLRATCEAIREQGGVVVVPHPFDPRRGGAGPYLDTILDLIDAVEGHNARARPAANARARAWAVARRLPLTAGSDAHTLAEIGRGAVRLPPFEPTRASLLAALRRGALARTVHSGLWVHVGSTYAKFARRFHRPALDLPGAEGGER
jgi:predicted metal-dependent phosphoesterase TrpH